MELQSNKELYAKLLAIQKEVTPVKKSETNPFFNSKYFDINTLLSLLKPMLSAQGLVLTQALTTLDGHLALTTSIVDATSGAGLSDTCPVPAQTDPQKNGSAITYYRRYALQSLLALEAEDDDATTVTAPRIVKTASELPLPPKKYEFARRAPTPPATATLGAATPKCEHGFECALRTTKTGKNAGRQFYCCSQPQGSQCKTWKWKDLYDAEQAQAKMPEQTEEEVVDYGQEE